MIGEQFYIAAIEIRKTYLKLINDMESYRKIAESTMKSLQHSIVDIENIKKDIKESRESKLQKEPDSKVVEKVMKVLENVETDGKRIENFIDPINREIEKLAREEQILYSKICDANPNLSEEQIVEAVRTRLRKEELI